ncbi:hypothetical protein ACGFYQ_27055 [Streptomyces sp. NPDC048258]|uniref:amino acid kinase family protein n=1 Tax=Streptomyces sp. NPDC048258 TaxID=3365527 RepID=UPI0037242F60
MSPGASPERVVIRVVTSSLVSGGRPDPGKFAALADDVVRLRADGIQPVVVGSGAVAVGTARLAAGSPAAAPARQLAAAVGQGPLFEAFRSALEARGLTAAQILLTPLDLTGREHRAGVRSVLEAVLDGGLVPFVSENDAVMARNHDVLAALLAASLRAFRLLLLTDAPVPYGRGPGRRSPARRVSEAAVMTPETEYVAGAAAQGYGTGGMSATLRAAWLATLAGVPVVIAEAATEDVVVRAAQGEDIGMLVHPRICDQDPDLEQLWRSVSAPSAGRPPSGPGSAPSAGAIAGDWRIIARGSRAGLGSADAGLPPENTPLLAAAVARLLPFAGLATA